MTTDEAKAGATEGPTRVVVAEDEVLIRLDLVEMLTEEGYDVVGQAGDGEAAVELTTDLRPDLVVMDVKMPHLDGIEAARRILAMRPVPIVMLTAYASQDLVDRAADVGVFGYLVKPFREADLVPAIATARARFVELEALRAEAASLADALATRKVLERAKGILMARDGLTEQQAFERIRKASQISGRPMRVIAEALLATFGDGDA